MSTPIRLSATILTLAFMTPVLVAAPVPKPKPKPVTRDFSGTELQFVKLKGLDAAKGILSKGNPITVTRMRQELRQRTVTRVVRGKPVQEVVPYTVMVPYTVQILETYGTKTHNVFDGNGKLIPANMVFDRLTEGQVVLVSSTPKLPEAYLDLLTSKAIILVPKK